MPNLFPEGYETEKIVPDEIRPTSSIGYRNGIAFDDELGDFLRDGKNMLLDSNGLESWKSWCINCLQTERYKHLAYSTDFGIELESALKSTSRDEAESILTRQITEAILADPYKRAEYVDFVEFDWTAPDAVEAHVVIKGKEDVTIDITAYITKGEI